MIFTLHCNVYDIIYDIIVYDIIGIVCSAYRPLSQRQILFVSVQGRGRTLCDGWHIVCVRIIHNLVP